MNLPFYALATLATAAVAMAVPTVEYTEEWQLWKAEHRKKYANREEELLRQAVWLSNRDYIQQHNVRSHDHGYTLAMNHFGDTTVEEFGALFGCYKWRNVTSPHLTKTYQRPLPQALPAAINWRTKNVVTAVKDQAQCGGCYAFSAVGAMEGAVSLALDRLVSLSEQNVLDCSVPYGNHGCNGGSVHSAFEYVIDNQGIDTEASYPYKGRQLQCKFDKRKSGGTVTGIVAIPSGSELDLQAAVATAGPVSVAIDASSNAFRFYYDGVFDVPRCSATNLSHTMLVIGYGVYNEKDYWLVKNSWGPNWGREGYILMARNRGNHCGIATDASFPTL